MSDLITQLEAYASVGSWERPRDAKALVLRGLRSPDPEARLAALEIVAEEMDDDLAAAVEQVLAADPETEVRARAAIALGPALEVMSEDEDWEGPELDDLILSKSCFHRMESLLERIYLDLSEPQLVRRRALEAAVRSPRPWQRAALRSAFSDEDPEWRLTAIFCMGFVAGFEAEILQAFESESPRLKLEAVRAVGAMGIEKVGGDLARLAGSEETPRDLRLAAIEALGSVQPEGTTDILDALLDSDDEEIAEMARETLSEMLLFLAAEEQFDEDESFQGYVF